MDPATIASLLIALVAVFQFGYIVIFQANKEKKRQDKEWFHRLVIEPKLNEVFNFFDSAETELDKIWELIDEDNVAEGLSYSDRLKSRSSEFRKTFIDLIYPIEPTLANNIQNLIDEFIDFCTEKIFNSDFEQDDYKQLRDKFVKVKSDIIVYLYYS